MSELVALKASLDRVDKTLALLIEISEEKTPQLKRDILEIVGTVRDGFHMEQLTEQARRSINTAINQSELKKLQQDVKDSSELLQRSIEKSHQYVRRGKEWSWFSVTLLFGIFGVFIGGAIVFAIETNQINKYQYAVNQVDTMANFLNSSCENKKAYGEFVNQQISCDKKWWSASSILNH